VPAALSLAADGDVAAHDASNVRSHRRRRGTHPMTWQQELDLFNERIARARSDCEAWRAAGQREKYLECYFLVESLESILDERLRRRAAAETRP
jgi:hypothetical protein